MSVTAWRSHCTRRDYEYNLPTIDGRETCKHYERVLLAIGREPVPAAFSPADVLGPPGGKHLEGESEFLVTDSGVPDHVTELSGVGDSDGFICCDCCGATGDTVNEGGHHGDCPTVTTDGGGIDTTPDTDEITETAEPVTVPVSGVLDKIT